MEKCRNNKWEISYDWFFCFDHKLRFFWVDNTWFYLNYRYIKVLKKKINLSFKTNSPFKKKFFIISKKSNWVILILIKMDWISMEYIGFNMLLLLSLVLLYLQPGHFFMMKDSITLYWIISGLLTAVGSTVMEHFKILWLIQIKKQY